MSTLTEAAAACCACLRVHWTTKPGASSDAGGRWLSQLMVTAGLVALLLRPQLPYSERGPKLRRALVELAEVCVARAPWWTRVKLWFAARGGR